MKHLKRYKKFLEDATANASNTAGMGGVVASQPGALPGTTGSEGSGDVSFTFSKERREKGDPAEVSDLRDLDEVDTDEIEDIDEEDND